MYGFETPPTKKTLKREREENDEKKYVKVYPNFSEKYEYNNLVSHRSDIKTNVAKQMAKMYNRQLSEQTYEEPLNATVEEQENKRPNKVSEEFGGYKSHSRKRITSSVVDQIIKRIKEPCNCGSTKTRLARSSRKRKQSKKSQSRTRTRTRKHYKKSTRKSRKSRKSRK